MANDAELLARWRTGDDAAGQQLCEQHHALVARIVGAHRPRAWGTDDLVQEVFLTMFSRCERYEARDGTPFAHWLARLAVNVCRERSTRIQGSVGLINFGLGTASTTRIAVSRSNSPSRVTK